jgi:hypothetical protein
MRLGQEALLHAVEPPTAALGSNSSWYLLHINEERCCYIETETAQLASHMVADAVTQGKASLCRSNLQLENKATTQRNRGEGVNYL